MSNEQIGGPIDGVPNPAISAEFHKIVAKELPDVAAAAAQRIYAADAGLEARTAPLPTPAHTGEVLHEVLDKVHNRYPGPENTEKSQ